MSPLPKKFFGVYNTCVSHMFRWMKMSDVNLPLYLMRPIFALSSRSRRLVDAYRKLKKPTRYLLFLFLHNAGNATTDNGDMIFAVIDETTKRAVKFERIAARPRNLHSRYVKRIHNTHKKRTCSPEDHRNDGRARRYTSAHLSSQIVGIVASGQHKRQHSHSQSAFGYCPVDNI